MQAKIVGRRLLQDGRLVFDAEVVVTPAKGDKPAVVKTGALLITRQQLETLQLLGDPAPKVGVVMNLDWSVDQHGVQSDKWLSL